MEDNYYALAVSLPERSSFVISLWKGKCDTKYVLLQIFSNVY